MDGRTETPVQVPAKETHTRKEAAGKTVSSWQERLNTEKRCSNCSQFLPLDAFVANRGAWKGLSSWCRECHRQATRDWRARNRDELNARRREQYRLEHPLHEGRRCGECGREIPATRNANALVCSPACRQARQAPQRSLRKRQRAA